MVDPTHQVFWFASRAFGIVAMLLLGVSVAVGLAMSGRLAHRPGLPAKLKHFHESATLVTLGLIVAHGGLLLFDSYLRPGLAGITLPFALSYRPLFTGVGIIAGWLAAILGLSFYARKRIGVKTWRFMHRFTIVVYLLALVHVIGSGTDARSPWMMALLTVTDGADRVRVHLPDAAELLPAAPGGRSRRKRRTSPASQRRHRMIAGARSHDASRITSRGGPGPVSRLRPPPPCRDTKPRSIVATRASPRRALAGGEDLWA